MRFKNGQIARKLVWHWLIELDQMKFPDCQAYEYQHIQKFVIFLRSIENIEYDLNEDNFGV